MERCISTQWEAAWDHLGSTEVGTKATDVILVQASSTGVYHERTGLAKLCVCVCVCVCLCFYISDKSHTAWKTEGQRDRVWVCVHIRWCDLSQLILSHHLFALCYPLQPITPQRLIHTSTHTESPLTTRLGLQALHFIYFLKIWKSPPPPLLSVKFLWIAL